MPIRPENKDRYPSNWKAIRQSVLERAGNRCEWCRVDNYAIGWRDSQGRFFQWNNSQVEALFAGKKPIRIILTVAHLDHQPENNDPSNLAALCQRCHNRHDVADRVKGKRGRRRARIAESQAVLKFNPAVKGRPNR